MITNRICVLTRNELLQMCCCAPKTSALTCPAVNPLTAGAFQTCAADPALLAKNKLLTCKHNLLAKHNALLLKFKELCWNMKQKLLRKITDVLTLINYKKLNKCSRCCYYDSETHYKDADHSDSCKKRPSKPYTHPLLHTFDNILERRADAWTNIRDKLAKSISMCI